jgi:hypothetical protein
VFRIVRIRSIKRGEKQFTCLLLNKRGHDCLWEREIDVCNEILPTQVEKQNFSFQPRKTRDIYNVAIIM